MTTSVEFVDRSPEYGWFGKTVARTDVTGMAPAEVAAEVAEMKRLVGEHVDTVFVETIWAAV